jgi:hypothetical protein
MPTVGKGGDFGEQGFELAPRQAAATGPASSQDIASERSAIAQNPLRIAARSFASPLGRAEAGGAQ